MQGNAETVASGGTIPTPESVWLAPRLPGQAFNAPGDYFVRVLVTWKTKVPTEYMHTWHIPMMSAHVVRVSGAQHNDGTVVEDES